MSQAAAKIGRNSIEHNREQGFLVGPNMHDSLAMAAFLDPSILKFKDYYVDVETTGELTAGETLGYSPSAGDLRRKPETEKQAAQNMPIRGSAPTLAARKLAGAARQIRAQCESCGRRGFGEILRSVDRAVVGNQIERPLPPVAQKYKVIQL